MEYITIYDVHTQQNEFNNNGLAVLCPISCEITEKANGEYSLSMVHPIDEYGIWRNINCFNNIKALGQIFTIRDVEHVYTGNQGKINVYADHIFYKMNDPWIFPDLAEPNTVISGSTATEIIQNAMNLADHVPFPDSIDYTFNFDSDVDVPQPYSRQITEGCTLLDAIIGDSGFLGTYGGELYRDNFHFSIRQEREGTQRNAFDIRVGLNLVGIKRRVDVSKFCSYFRAYDHLGQWWAIAYHQDSYSALPIANSVVRSQNFKFDTDSPDISMGNLSRAGGYYWGKHFKPNISYTVDLRDVKNNSDFKQFGNHFRYRVGDYGRVYDERLGGALELRITETVKDAITGETLKVVFGDLSGFVKESGYTPVPVMPSMPPVREIAIIALDSNLDETSDITYVDTFRKAKLLLAEKLTKDEYVMYKVVISQGFTFIPDFAFDRGASLYDNLAKVSIPETITGIGIAAFTGCVLVELSIPLGVTAIDGSAFAGCKLLKSVSIPDSVQTLGAGCFSGCISLKTVEIGNGITSIGANAFEHCSRLLTIKIHRPSGSVSGAPWDAPNATVIWTGDSHSDDSYDSTKVTVIQLDENDQRTDTTYEAETLADAVNYIKAGSNRYDVVIGEDCITEISSSIFSGVSNISHVSILSQYVTTIGNGAFASSGLTSITLPTSLTAIGQATFSSCGNLTSIVIPSGCNSIGAYAFAGCSALADVTISDGITSLSSGMFTQCTGLTSIDIPASVTTIASDTFASCTNLAAITVAKAEGSISGAPWGATNAVVTWSG